MTDETTPLDRAAMAMGEDAEAERAFWGELAGTELYLALEDDAGGDTVTPQIFEVEGARYVLAFDRPERLAAFAEGPAAHATLSGRSLAAMLAGQGIGLALNPEAGASSMLLGPEAIDWLAQLLDGPAPAEVTARVEEIAPPGDLPEQLLLALDRRLATATGRARMAYLVRATGGGGAGHLLAFVDPAPGAEAALAALVQEALIFSGLEAGALDVTFLPATSPVAARLAKVGLRFDLPQPETASPPAPPGMDPDRPPRLR